MLMFWFPSSNYVLPWQYSKMSVVLRNQSRKKDVTWIDYLINILDLRKNFNPKDQHERKNFMPTDFTRLFVVQFYCKNVAQS